MKRVLVTGASGFIGSHSLPLLVALGFEVHAIAYRKMFSCLDGVRWRRADLLDTATIRALFAEVSPTHLLHFAWFAEPGKYLQSNDNSLWRQASIDLLRTFAASGGQRAVLAGTCFEYDLANGYCSEAFTPCVPATPYGVSKLAVARALPGLSHLGISTVWARVFHLYGPRENPQRLVSSVILSLLNGDRARCTHGRQVRDFMHVGDLASAFVSLLESEVEGVVNIGSGKPVSVRDVVLTIAEAMDASEAIDFGAIPTVLNDPPILIPDVSRLRDEVRWTPRFTLNDGLAHTIDWWRSRTAAVGL